MEQILHSMPWISKSDLVAVSSTLSSCMLAQGERVRSLEKRLAKWLNAADGVGIGSGAAGVVLALHGVGVRVADEVILPTYVCRSVLEAVLTVGAIPVFCDVSYDWTMRPSNVRRVISGKTRAIVVPHLYGIFTEINAFREFGVPIVEDCAQALDGFGKRSIKGDVAVLSFHPTKCLTSGEGGMVISSSAEVIDRMRSYRDGGVTEFRPRLFSPLSDIAASLVLSQLDRYEDSLLRRREISNAYIKTIKSYCPDAINENAFVDSMFFRFPIRVAGGLAACQQAFSAFGVQVREGVDALLHRWVGQADEAFPVSVELIQTTVSIPIYPALTPSQESRCIEALAQVLPRFH